MVYHFWAGGGLTTFVSLRPRDISLQFFFNFRRRYAGVLDIRWNARALCQSKWWVGAYGGYPAELTSSVLLLDHGGGARNRPHVNAACRLTYRFARAPNSNGCLIPTFEGL